MNNSYFLSFLLAVIICNFEIVVRYPSEVWSYLMLMKIISLSISFIILYVVVKMIKKIIKIFRRKSNE
jgi:hypothetical protein